MATNNARPANESQVPKAEAVKADDKDTLRRAEDIREDDTAAQEDARGFDGGAALVTLVGGSLNLVSVHDSNESACEEGRHGVAGTREVYVLPLGKVRQTKDGDQ